MDGKAGGFCGAAPSKARLRVTLSPTGTTLRSSVALRLAADAAPRPSSQSTLTANAFEHDAPIVRISPKVNACSSGLSQALATPGFMEGVAGLKGEPAPMERLRRWSVLTLIEI